MTPPEKPLSAGRKSAVGDDGARLAIRQHKRHPIRRKLRVHRHVSRPGLQDAEQARHGRPSNAGAKVPRNPRAPRRAPEEAGQAIGATFQFAVGHPRVGAEQGGGVRAGVRLALEQLVQQSGLEQTLSRLVAESSSGCVMGSGDRSWHAADEMSVFCI